MAVIIIEGPEKAGKSTLAAGLVKALKESGETERVITRHWVGRATPDDRVYSDALRTDSMEHASQLVSVWDRGWPSEYVYGTLLKQDRRLANYPWLGEWLHGRAVRANGLAVMLLGPSAEELTRRRDGSDLPVHPEDERGLYRAYAERYGWSTIDSQWSVADMVDAVLAQFRERVRVQHRALIPPTYCGQQNAQVVFVGEKRSAGMLKGGWLPFSSRMTTALGRVLGDRAFEVGWTNAHDCPPPALSSARVLVPCGNLAYLWVRNYVTARGGDQQVYPIAHPSHAFRFNNAVAGRERVSVHETIAEIMRMKD